jgi:hypothetical protein
MGQALANENGRTDAHRTKMAAEDSLPERLDVWDPFVEGNHDRQASEEQDQDGDDNQPPDRDAQHGIIKVVEGCPSSNVYEASNVEEKIYDGTEHGLLGLPVEETIPSKSGTTTKRGKEVISAEHCTGTDYQKSERDILGNVGLPVDQPVSLTELHEVPEPEPKDGTINNRKQYLIWWMRERG